MHMMVVFMMYPCSVGCEFDDVAGIHTLHMLGEVMCQVTIFVKTGVRPDEWKKRG